MLTSCVVVTSSLAATTSSNGGDAKIYSASTRVTPLPTGPYANYFEAYAASKVLTFEATENFMASKHPHFTIVNVMPTFVIGANELVTDPKRITNGTNFLPMEVLLRVKNRDAFIGQISFLDDVARVHVVTLDEEKVKGKPEFLGDEW
jgi:nucleoside-diphosphate-sugar epimerase